MSVPLLSDLREPPVVGRYYMVPVIEYSHHGRTDLWPTLGPLHHDHGEVNFPHLHFHVDARFLTARQANFLANKGGWMFSRTVETNVAIYPLCRTGEPVPPRAHLVKRKCRVSGWKYSPPSKPKWQEALEVKFGAPAEPVRIKGGRLLCPHRKVDLSSFEPDADGIVTCPLHGLRVKCGSAAS